MHTQKQGKGICQGIPISNSLGEETALINVVYMYVSIQEERKKRKLEEEAKRKAEKERRRKEAEQRAGPKTPNFTIVKKERSGAADDDVSIVNCFTFRAKKVAGKI